MQAVRPSTPASVSSLTAMGEGGDLTRQLTYNTTTHNATNSNKCPVRWAGRVAEGGRVYNGVVRERCGREGDAELNTHTHTHKHEGTHTHT
jgi:hypothetical protein